MQTSQVRTTGRVGTDASVVLIGSVAVIYFGSAAVIYFGRLRI